MLHGRFIKQRGGWSAECEAIGAFTQGVSRKDAAEALADVVEIRGELRVETKQFRATLLSLRATATRCLRWLRAATSRCSLLRY